MKRPRVSVVIPVYNRPRRVCRAVDSVLAQTYKDFELIVVDDGSTDGTAQALAGYSGRIHALSIPHMGVSAARNRGIEASGGELIALLDSDDWWLPEKLGRQVDFFDQRPDLLISQTEELWIRNGRRVNPAQKHRKPEGEAFFRSLELCLISPSSVMMRRSLLEETGLFDENLPACEDYDLWLRVTARHPVGLVDEALVVKTGGHEDQLSRTTMGLDRYRVRALEKIIAGGLLNREQTKATRQALAEKARVYGLGCIKRGRRDEGERYLILAEEYGGQ